MPGARQLAVVVVLTTLVGCTSDVSEARAELDAAREQWSEVGPTSYTFTVFIGNESRGDRRYAVRVEDGEVIAVEPEPGSDGADAENFFTVPALFATIEQWWLGDHSVVTYNEAIGYPEAIDFDDPTVDDDASTVRITDFEPAGP